MEIFKDKEVLRSAHTSLSDLYDQSHETFRYHLLITGWTEKNDICDQYNTFNLSVGKYHTFKKDDFCCIDFYLDDFIHEANYDTIYDTIKKSLNLFHNYINVALAYENSNKGIEYFYKARISNIKSKHVVELLNRIIDFFKIKVQEAAHSFSDKLLERYLHPGVEIVSERLFDDIKMSEVKLSEMLILLRNKIEKSKSFFEMPFYIKSATYHLYHHLNHSFPLPVLLKSKLDMPKPEDYWDFENWSWEESDNGENIDNDENGKKGLNNSFQIDDVYKKNINELKDLCLLGYYSHDDEYGCFGPHIVLCPENIENEAERQGLKEELVYLIVLVHELAHAMMDKKRTKGYFKSLFARAMEESLANRITLEWFEKYDKSNTKKVIKYIETQPLIYKFGIKQYQANVDWTKWEESYKNMHYLLKIWFDTCFIKNVKKDTVIKAYNQVFEINLDALIELFKKVAVNKLEEGSIGSYCNSIKKCDNLNNHMTCDWFARTIMEKHSDDYDPLSFWEQKIEDAFNKTSLNQKTKQNHISGCKKFVQCILGFYYANIWLQIDKDDSLFCELVAKNALFASKEVVDDVKAGKLGSNDNIRNKGKNNDYASWDYMMHVRTNNRNLKNNSFPDSNSATCHLGKTVIGDDNTIANLAIKNAVIESYKRKYKGIIPDISLLKDYEACHIWDLPKDRRYYASIANLILLPRALAKLTDHNDAVKELLRYKVFKRFGFKPDGYDDPKRPKNYKKYVWRDDDVL